MGKKQLYEIGKNVFWQLLFFYSLFILLIAFGFLEKYSLQFHLVAIAIGILGFFILLDKNENKKILKLEVNLFRTIFCAGIFLIIFFRVVPYFKNSIPLGYDAGLYRYGLLYGLKNLDGWILNGGMEPGFLYLMEIFKYFLDVDSLLTMGFIFFSLALGLCVYFYVKESFGEKIALVSFIFYALSAVQFKTFWFMYYKNVIGLCFMLLSLLFLRRYEKREKKFYLVLFIIFGGLLGSIHRPTFYIFGLSFFVYAFTSPLGEKYDIKKLSFNLLSGFLMLMIAFSFYIGKFMPAVTSVLPWVAHGFISPGESPGTFISFFQYQYLVLAYLPFALIGALYFFRKKEFDIVFIWAFVNFIIVYFQFFFFNRFIIHLDMALIIMAGIGFKEVIEKKRVYGSIIFIILFVSSCILLYNQAYDSKPLISEEELDMIKIIKSNVEPNSSIMVLSSKYSPWMIGYSDLEGKRIIAPGLFDSDKWSQDEWELFWNNPTREETVEMMSVYQKPIYLYSGVKHFENPCFNIYKEENAIKLYKYEC